MNFKTCLAAALAAALLFVPLAVPLRAQSTATLLPPGKQCFQATAGVNGMVGALGTITGGSSYVAGTYGGVALTGGSGSGATANITVAGGAVTAVTVLNPGVQYVTGDVLSASAASIGGSGSGFSVPVASTSINSSLAGGSVAYYVPTTLTTKQTWQNSGETVLNSNPVPLDANGCAIVYGSGNYRQILKDNLGNTVWDVVTASTGGGSGSSGTAVLGDNSFVGTVLVWSALTAPTNYMFAAGQPISRTTYAQLLNALTYSTTITCSATSNLISGIADTTQIPIGAPLEAACFSPGTRVTAKTSSSVTLNNTASISLATTGVFFPWGDGDGVTTFNLPDLRGVVLPGRDNMNGIAAGKLTAAYYAATLNTPDALGVPGGNQNQTLQLANIPPYTPSGTITNGAITTTTTSFNINSSNTSAPAGGPTYGVTTAAPAPIVSTQATSTFAGAAMGGMDTPFSIVQPSVTINYIIKVTADTITAGVAGITTSFPLSVAVTSPNVLNVSLLFDTAFFGLNGANQLTMSPALGSMAYQNSSAVAITGGTITGMPTPTNASDAAPKSYVDALASGIHAVVGSRLATAAALPANTYSNGASGVGATLTEVGNGALTVDGVATATNDVILVKNEAAPANNGIYVVTNTGSAGSQYILTRHTTFDQASEMLAGSTSFVSFGTVNAGTNWQLFANVTTVGSTAAVFNQFGSTGVASFNLRSGVVSPQANDYASLSGLALNNCAISAAVSTNNLTFSMTDAAGNTPSATSPCVVVFRNATATNGTTVARVVSTATTLTFNSGATIGTTNNIPFRIWVEAFDTGSTAVLAASLQSNASTIFSFPEYALQSSTACSACTTAATAGVFYTTATQTSRPWRIMGYAEWNTGLATAGAWSSGPTSIQMFGEGVAKPGQVIQSLQFTTASVTTITSTAYTNTNCTASITPTSAANYIYTDWEGDLTISATGASGAIAQLSRGGTTVGVPKVGSGSSSVTTIVGERFTDAPGSLISTTYTVQVKGLDTNANFFPNSAGGCALILAEIMG